MNIMKMQLALKKAGFFEGVCDGKWNLKTEIAVRKLQKAAGLISDGVINEMTGTLLDALIREYEEYEAYAYTD